MRTVARRDPATIEAISAATMVRAKAGVALSAPLCVYDLAEEKLGIEVRFAAIPSMEGLYRNVPPQIIISSLRPAGRRAFTCAHEIGHHVLGHGYLRIEELSEGEPREDNDVECLANRFAFALLMPKSLVTAAFASRAWAPTSITPEQAFNLAGWIGVGYATFVKHLCIGLRLIDQRLMERLLKVQPIDIRSSLLGKECKSELLVVDHQWQNRPVDLSVGDVLLLPPDVECEGKILDVASRKQHATIVHGLRPGIGRVMCPRSGWAAFARVSRCGYAGLGKYRHLEDDDAC